MKEVPIQDLAHGVVKGIALQMPGEGMVDREEYYEWAPSGLAAVFQTNSVAGGVLISRPHPPRFEKAETHIDAEMFYFRMGTALMLFIDLDGETPIMHTAQVVRVQPGTQMVVPPGKGHYVPVPEYEERLEIIVVAPKMGDILIPLPEPVVGVAS